ncbi:hypothetical protein MRX96_003916 [Rhipicephalus microplus]
MKMAAVVVCLTEPRVVDVANRGNAVATESHGSTAAARGIAAGHLAGVVPIAVSLRRMLGEKHGRLQPYPTLGADQREPLPLCELS